LLQFFKQANSEPLASFILQTPKHKIKAIPNGYNEQSAQPMKQKSLWKSPRLQQKAFEGKSLMKKAQELIAKKCGVLEEEQSMDNMILQQYLNLYKQPLSENSVDAIMTLSEVAQDLKKKDRKKKKEDWRCSRQEEREGDLPGGCSWRGGLGLPLVLSGLLVIHVSAFLPPCFVGCCCVVLPHS
jgi:hypothetical protein